MGKLIDKINKDMKDLDLVERSAKSRKWLLQTVNKLKKIDRKKDIVDDRERHANRTFIGKIYFFFYDPKTKDDLPYYDSFPLVIPIERYKDGFLGLNLHYIPAKLRIRFLDKLYDIISNDKFDHTTKLKITYEIVSGASRFKEFAPCLKRYLRKHIKTEMVDVGADNWEIAAVLPVEFFAKEKLKTIFEESMEKIKNGI
jgi:hypothetical protein